MYIHMGVFLVRVPGERANGAQLPLLGHRGLGEVGGILLKQCCLKSRIR